MAKKLISHTFSVKFRVFGRDGIRKAREAFIISNGKSLVMNRRDETESTVYLLISTDFYNGFCTRFCFLCFQQVISHICSFRVVSFNVSFCNICVANNNNNNKK